MKTTRRNFLLLMSSIFNFKVYSCIMDPSFKFRHLDEKKSDNQFNINDMETFLNKKHGLNNWEYNNDNDFFLKLPKIPENTFYIPITIGSEKNESVGVFDELTIYAEECFWILKDKYTKEYLPDFNNVIDFSKNSDKAFKFKTYEEKRIIKIASFKFYGNAFPLVSTRLNLSRANEVKIFCVFKSSTHKGLIKVIKQDKTMYTEGLGSCSTTYYIKGEWPEGIQEGYGYSNYPPLL
ncbi:MAG: hypothetical protein FE834_09685 [Gammaproteobacteria bacterium]|nr:hypothetical protein [Gammaproteobacteria bacterium]